MFLCLLKLFLAFLELLYNIFTREISYIIQLNNKTLKVIEYDNFVSSFKNLNITKKKQEIWPGREMLNKNLEIIYVEIQ